MIHDPPTSLMIHGQWWPLWYSGNPSFPLPLQENSDDEMEGGLGSITIELKTGARDPGICLFSAKQPVLEINSVMTCRHCSVCNIEFPTGEIHMVCPCLFTLPCCSIPRIFCWFVIGSSGGEEEDPEEDPTVEVHGGLERTPGALEGGGQMGYTHNNDGDIYIILKLVHE